MGQLGQNLWWLEGEAKVRENMHVEKGVGGGGKSS